MSSFDEGHTLLKCQGCAASFWWPSEAKPFPKNCFLCRHPESKATAQVSRDSTPGDSLAVEVAGCAFVPLSERVPESLLALHRKMPPVVMSQCPHCGSYAIFKLPDGGKKCLTCRKKFSSTNSERSSNT